MSKDSRFPQKPVAQLLGSNGPIHAVSYSASPGTYILTGSADRSIRLYNPSPSSSTNTTTTTTTSSITTPNNNHRQSPPANSSKPTLRTAGGDRAVFLWDVVTAQTTRRFGATANGHSGRVNCVAFGGADDSLVISGGLDTTVRVWDARASGGGGSKPIQVLGEAKDAVTALAVSGAEIVAASVDGRVRSYDVRTGRAVTDVFPASVTSLCLARDAKTVLVGSLDSKIRLMDRANGACLRTYTHDEWRNAELRVQSVLGGRERFVVAGDEMTSSSASAVGGDIGAEGDNNNEGRVWAWDLLTGRLVARLAVPWGVMRDGRRRVVVGRDGKEKERKNVVSCLAWKEGGSGNQFCVGGTSGVVTVFGEG
ncbi:WD40-repeat-containing domain protein [Cercophora scortea]|uniref:WD40-repeat-containing domain protein n=1 Tax=Cercophora scortea TaxID=314031 RepID=A0AAE0IMQ8_9PEZI|nr:WD40-repeat-containing domain protein [Cercophora scortea]